MANKGNVSEDKVEYRLFPIIPFGINKENEVSYLEEQLDACIAQLGSYLVDYIWQNEPFILRVVPTTGSVPGHLHGCTDYGDNVEDEWFIVFLLLHLTENIPGLIAKVCDVTDGEILLIEAANNIPKWLNPETADNRVFVYNGQVHIIPQPKSPADIGVVPAGEPSIEEALQLIRQHTGLTLAGRRVQRDIHARIAGYPEKAAENRHIAHCYIPACLAAVLEHSPELLAPMVQAFYLRDPIDLKVCRTTFRVFQPGTRVMAAVRFTRCLYAQLAQQQFSPHRLSGYTLPPTQAPEFMAHQLGMKLAHGAEILASRSSSSKGGGDGGEEATDAMNANPTTGKGDVRWQRFISSLRQKGFFRGELEGSRTYSELEDSAKKYYYSTVANKPGLGGEGEHGRWSGREQEPGEKLQRVLKHITATGAADVEQWKRKAHHLPPQDDDAWLSVTPEQFEAMLNAAGDRQAAGGAGDSNGGGGGEPEPDFNLASLAHNMKQFVEKTSSHEGAELPKSASSRDSSRDSTGLNFDPNGIIHSMQKMFEFADDASSGSSDDMDEYGSDDDLAEPVPTAAAPEIHHFMEMMDRELAKTKVGQSFEREAPAPKAPPRKKKQQQKSSSSSSSSKAPESPESPVPPSRPARPPRPSAKSPSKPPGPPPKAAAMAEEEDIDEEEDEFQPVSVDMTVVKNLLESYNSQEGLAGPTSNLLASMGVHIPPNKDKK